MLTKFTVVDPLAIYILSNVVPLKFMLYVHFILIKWKKKDIKIFIPIRSLNYNL